MEFQSFSVSNYRAIRDEIKLSLKNKGLIPLVGINECGKTTILHAIFSFDYINDSEYGGKHLENTLNLYQTEDKEPLVTAELQTKKEEIFECLNAFKTAQASVQPNPLEQEDITKMDSILSDTAAQLSGLTIKRNLQTKLYSIPNLVFSELSPTIQDKLSRFLIRYLPYILYNDDFTDRPETSIDVPTVKPEQLSGWLSIYEKLFRMTKDTYSLFSLIAEKDERRKESILSDVQEHLNNTLTEAWKTFHLGRKEVITAKLTLTPNQPVLASPFKLNIRIVEKIGTKDRFFNVVDRSKGFLWFYNFVMKLQFNPKVVGGNKTIYLLDEPGSYLHSSAQEKLCAKIKEISETQGFVIYCTHSHHLLNPANIPLNSVYIVEKEKDKNVKITPLPLFKTKSEKTNALQPILEALHIPAFDFFDSANPVVLLEGMHDKYALELFTSLDFPFNIFPGVSADSILKTIQLMIAYARVYVAIWDNDKEGRETLEKGKKLFGEKEAEKFDLLPSNNPKKTRMEEMFTKDDFEMMRTQLSLPSEATYESLISTVYYSKASIRKRIKGKLTTSAQSNFAHLDQVIAKRIENAKKLVESRA